MELGPTEGTGGGPSLYEARTPYQFLVKDIVGSSRGTPDVAAVADPFTGVWIYDTNLSGWLVVGGTSLSTPVWVGIANAAGRFNNSTTAELAQIYASASLFEEAARGFTDITSARAVSDPTSRASWLPKAGTSAPGSAARSVISANKDSPRFPALEPRAVDEAPAARMPVRMRLRRVRPGALSPLSDRRFRSPR